MFVIACYDVPAHRTERYRKLLARYLHWKQQSVFMGDLSETLYKRMRYEIRQMLQESDRLAFVTTANRHNMAIEMVEEGQSRHEDHHRGSGLL